MIERKVTSRRISNTPSPVFDHLPKMYPSVKYNMSPGTPSSLPDQRAITACQGRLNNSRAVAQWSRYDELIGLNELREGWLRYLFGEDKENSDVSGAASLYERLIPGHEVMITAGANQAFVNVVLSICDEGDEVIVPVPYYYSHLRTLTTHNVRAVFVPVDQYSFVPAVDDIVQAITPRTRAVILTNPGNPTGVVLPPKVLDDISEACKQHRIYLCLDEAYREYDFSDPSRATSCYSPKLHDHCIKVYTMSKAFGLAGWRVGAVIYPRALGAAMRKAQETIPTHAALFSQAIATEALKYTPPHPETARQIRHVFVDTLKTFYETHTPFAHLFVIPTGTFYLFVPFRQAQSLPLTDTPLTDDDAVHILATDHGVLAAPGYAFGMPGYLRVCYGALKVDDAPHAAKALANGLKAIVSKDA